MTAFEHAGRLLIVDCGVLFPEDHHPGVDLILPDWSSIRTASRHRRGAGADARPRGPHRRDAVPPARAGDIPLVGSKPRWRCSAASCASTASARPSTTRSRRATESAQAVRPGVRRRQPLDPRRARGRDPPAPGWCCTRRLQDGPLAGPPDHRPARVRAAGGRGVDLFLTDSTNAETPGFTPAREVDLPVIDQVFRDSDRRIIVACFASRVHRVQQVLDAAYAHERQVAYVGRSMVPQHGDRRDLGYLRVPPACSSTPRTSPTSRWTARC